LQAAWPAGALADPGAPLSKLHFRYAAMNAGKSTALLQAAYNYEERAHVHGRA
jgi:Thymidine kinase